MESFTSGFKEHPCAKHRARGMVSFFRNFLNNFGKDYVVLADLHFDSNFPVYCWSTNNKHECGGSVLLRSERSKIFVGTEGTWWLLSLGVISFYRCQASRRSSKTVMAHCKHRSYNKNSWTHVSHSSCTQILNVIRIFGFFFLDSRVHFSEFCFSLTP